MNTISNIKPNLQKAVFLAKKLLPELVYDAVKLEGINYTLPEIQTLLDGITIGGHKRSDETIALNQAAAWRELFNLVEQKKFAVDQKTALDLHRIAADQEALSSGEFRNGGVTISGTDYLPPKAAELNNLWQAMCQQAETIEPIYDRAIFVFLQMARSQFFYDVNKRMGRFMMNGILLAAGYPVINVPATRQIEFNKLMLKFYESNDVFEMTEFMKSCLAEKIIDIMSE